MDAATERAIAEIQAVQEQAEEDRLAALRGEVIVSARVADLPMVVDEFLPGWQETGCQLPGRVDVSRRREMFTVVASGAAYGARGVSDTLDSSMAFRPSVAWQDLGREMARELARTMASEGGDSPRFRAQVLGKWSDPASVSNEEWDNTMGSRRGGPR